MSRAKADELPLTGFHLMDLCCPKSWHFASNLKSILEKQVQYKQDRTTADELSSVVSSSFAMIFSLFNSTCDWVMQRWQANIFVPDIPQIIPS